MASEIDKVRALLRSIRDDFSDGSVKRFIEMLLCQIWELDIPGPHLVRVRASGFPFDLVQGGYLLDGHVVVLLRAGGSVVSEIIDAMYAEARRIPLEAGLPDHELMKRAVMIAWLRCKANALEVARRTACPVEDRHIQVYRQCLRVGSDRVSSGSTESTVRNIRGRQDASAREIMAWLGRVPRAAREDAVSDWCPPLSFTPEWFVPNPYVQRIGVSAADAWDCLNQGGVSETESPREPAPPGLGLPAPAGGTPQH